MAKKYDFRPDPEGSGDFGKLLLTKLQRRNLMRWSSYALICIVGLLLQDVFLILQHGKFVYTFSKVQITNMKYFHISPS